MVPESRPTLAESFGLMGTVVTIRAVADQGVHILRAGIGRALDAMRRVEAAASRFDENSELRALTRTWGEDVSVSPMLFHALKVARAMAELTDGMFDPTVGRRMELMGFNRHYLTGDVVKSDFAETDGVSFRDVILIEEDFRVRLQKPMGLDLGAVAKGLAVDAAAQELADYAGFVIDAGGDVYVGGLDPDGARWRVGVEDPRSTNRLIATLQVSNQAVCTSGSYKRKSPNDHTSHHLIDAKTGQSVDGLLSATVVGPTAILADVAATAAFLLGRDRALPFMEELGLTGLVVSNGGEVRQTSSLEVFRGG